MTWPTCKKLGLLLPLARSPLWVNCQVQHACKNPSVLCRTPLSHSLHFYPECFGSVEALLLANNFVSSWKTILTPALFSSLLLYPGKGPHHRLCPWLKWAPKHLSVKTLSYTNAPTLTQINWNKIRWNYFNWPATLFICWFTLLTNFYWLLVAIELETNSRNGLGQLQGNMIPD